MRLSKKLTERRIGTLDYILKNGTIVDGTMKKPYIGSIIIEKGKIRAITGDDIEDGENVIDVSGKIVAPGFIDIHSHSDTSYFGMDMPTSKLNQGITTEIVGNCGVSAVPVFGKYEKETISYINNILEAPMEADPQMLKSIKDYKKKSTDYLFPINIGVLIGHGTLRGTVMGFDYRNPTTEEMDHMCELLEQELTNGALGLSLGLIYPPGSFSETSELLELAKVLKRNDAILAVHMRNEGSLIFQALDEVLEICKATGVHLHISHLKLLGKNQWSKSIKLLNKIRNAKDRGLNITCDQYPYDATSTSLTALLPNWAHDGGTEKMLARLERKDVKLDSEIRLEMEQRGGPKSIAISGTKGYMTEVEGLTVYEASKLLNMEPVETVKNIISTAKGNVAAVYYSLNRDDMLNIMKEKYIAIGSDGYAFSLDPKICDTNPHPRSFGSFPRFLELVRENKMMPIEDAIYKITKLPADILGIKNRGSLLKDKIADIVVFDFNKIRDNSTFEDSVQKPSGIEHVFVNGEPAILHGQENHLEAGIVVVK